MPVSDQGAGGRGAPGGGKDRPALWRLFRERLDAAGWLVDAPEAQRKEKEADIVDGLAQEVSRTGFGTVGIFLAEGLKPLSFITAQGLHFLTPHLGLLLGSRRVSNVACLLEDRANLERLARRLEELEEERRARPHDGRGTREPD